MKRSGPRQNESMSISRNTALNSHLDPSLYPCSNAFKVHFTPYCADSALRIEKPALRKQSSFVLARIASRRNASRNRDLRFFSYNEFLAHQSAALHCSLSSRISPCMRHSVRNSKRSRERQVTCKPSHRLATIATYCIESQNVTCDAMRRDRISSRPALRLRSHWATNCRQVFFGAIEEA